MENDKGAFFLLVMGDISVEYDNAEAARIAAHKDEKSNPNRTRRLFKCLPYHEPIEIMI